MRNMKTRSATVFALLLLAAAEGCSPGEVTRYPVSGTVTMNGAPAGLTTVKFIPAGAGMEPTFGGSATADGTGAFRIGKPGENSGLPAGEYKVTFSQTVHQGKPVYGSGGKKSEPVPGKEAVPDAYRDAATTPVTATVSKTSTTFAFEIAAPK